MFDQNVRRPDTERSGSSSEQSDIIIKQTQISIVSTIWQNKWMQMLVSDRSEIIFERNLSFWISFQFDTHFVDTCYVVFPVLHSFCQVMSMCPICHQI